MKNVIVINGDILTYSDTVRRLTINLYSLREHRN